MSDTPLKVWLDRDGKLLRLRLNRPKANIVDAPMIAALSAALKEYAGKHDLLAVLLDAEGPHFSFGASVEEHLPGSFEGMLKGLHALIGQMLDFPVPILVAIRGQCLGGGLEVAAAGHLLFATPNAVLGQPEIKVGVFAPAASCLLPVRMGQARAEDLLYSGRAVSGEEAAQTGLVNQAAADPEAAALAYFDENLAKYSAEVLRFAVKAAHSDAAERIKTKLAAVEKLYVEKLMATNDAVEGLRAFVEKRAPKWQHS